MGIIIFALMILTTAVTAIYASLLFFSRRKIMEAFGVQPGQLRNKDTREEVIGKLGIMKRKVILNHELSIKETTRRKRIFHLKRSYALAKEYNGLLFAVQRFASTPLRHIYITDIDRMSMI